MKTTAIFTTRTTPNECSKGLEFVSNGDGTCTVSRIGTCTDTGIKIPSVYNGEKVTSIGDFAFYGCSNLTSISIPNSVTSIGKFAFYDCRSLTSISIPNSVTSIGESAFKGCTGLTSVTIPTSVTNIGKWAFSGCTITKSLEFLTDVTGVSIMHWYEKP